mmetsp:Transcript_24656/g.44517  ORF Transcript_24656/g.44517 Transcript_24656/m.44517 type:complete len:209 (+) Transcript_24656:713-1339(+)
MQRIGGGGGGFPVAAEVCTSGTDGAIGSIIGAGDTTSGAGFGVGRKVGIGVSTRTGCSATVVLGMDAGGRVASCVGFGVVVLGIMGSGVRFGVGLEVASISTTTRSASSTMSMYSSPSKVSRYFSDVSAAASMYSPPSISSSMSGETTTTFAGVFSSSFLSASHVNRFNDPDNTLHGSYTSHNLAGSSLHLTSPVAGLASESKQQWWF